MFSPGLGFLVVCEMEITKFFFLDNNFTSVVFPAPDGEDSIIITPSFFEGIEISNLLFLR